MSTISKMSAREHALKLVEDSRFTNFILGVILFNAIVLGMQTATETLASWQPTLYVLDKACLAIFVIELLLRLYVWRGRFFKDPWSIFDLTVVAIALVPASGPLAVLRALRVLRVLRVLTIVPSMRRVVAALLGALPGLGAIGMLLMLIYYVFAVIATDLFGDKFPDWFGSIGLSFYTLFQVMTLESWSMGISRPVMQEFPYAWLFFVPFILVATFTILNLFIAIIVNAMQTFAEQDHAAEREAQAHEADRREQHLQEQLASIHEEIRQLRQALAKHGDQQQG
ncbi:ion transporter [Orrella daihaiensis]|uniref:Ion transporter n=1 Tax=Orrella daihaiensis TaxID=2782176 RepID=A0ABY4AKR5_9BURK|nr:ion transporter [Orrella daihaiensis]UOD50879.1 ion transporter [Orrella daihaiensis]